MANRVAGLVDFDVAFAVLCVMMMRHGIASTPAVAGPPRPARLPMLRRALIFANALMLEERLHGEQRR